MQLSQQMRVVREMARPDQQVEKRVRTVLGTVWESGIPQAWLGTMVATVLGLLVLGHVDRPNLLWPVSGIALALCLPQWQRGWGKRIRLLLGSAAGFWTAAVMLGMPWRMAAMISVLTCIDIVLGGWALSPAVKTFEDLKDERNILTFLLAAVVIPMVTGSLGAYPVAMFLKLPVMQTLMMNVMGNSLGIAACLPLVLLLRSGDWLGLDKMGPGGQARDKLRIAATSTFFVAVSTFVFWQRTSPFLFMVFPPMILLILTMGLEGSVLASVALSIIGWFGTMHGHGPIMLAKGTSMHQFLVFQGFVWISLATSLPVGALLDERRRAEHRANESESIYKVLLQNTEDLIILSSIDGSQRYVSPGVTRLAGWTQEEYLAMNRFETFHPDDQEMARSVVRKLSTGVQEQTMQYRMREKSGGWKWVRAVVRAYGVEGEAIAGYVGTIRDISDQKQIEESWRRERQGLVTEKRQMAALANTDPLTGLLNRRGFEEQVEVLKRRGSFPVALLMVDIDHFKRYNDRYGHLQGDACLTQVAQVLRSHATRTNDIAARLGGEEFTVVLVGAGMQDALRVAEAMQSVLRSVGLEHGASPFGVVTISAGVSVQAGGELDIEQLMAQADSALYMSKRVRNRVTGYSKQEELVRT
ncbi:diguanylate cyclase (GGDEF)-like protein/PAS domain S-box-containing protein [Granulicella aggregans]|uniref:diguanylate cyclase n=1 Tax=Granulicella aggregans TaxID=474949 RepID=A0A7W8E2W8_9BACT|nr:diguanylate cyclase [Granulicella aggregans]MBB5057363.1 diguanylate cyclase (GGDEF)-like protein/PAS domain S-box-containing protein [Granulicella aggregans]